MRMISVRCQHAWVASLLISLSGHVPPGCAATLLVWPDSPAPAPPYCDWGSAAHTIQDAVDAALAGDEVLVTNGVYAQGGRSLSYLDFRDLTNRVAVDRPVTVRSVNGPEVTVIQGYQVPETTHGFSAAGCAYLTNGAVLTGFTLTNGATLPQFARADTEGGRSGAKTGPWSPIVS